MSVTRSEPDDHLEDIDDGCGCVETWERLSELRDE
jgi:hypothetical protein